MNAFLPRISRAVRRATLFVSAFVCLLFLTLLSGCGKGASSVQAGQIAGVTSDALVTVLLGTPPEATRQAPPDKPLLTPSGYNRVLIASDEQGFAAVSKGAWGVADVRSLTERVVKDVDKRISKNGKNDFHAAQTTFPPPAPSSVSIGEAGRTLIATLTPATQVSGSPDDIASNRAKVLLLVRLTISDAQTGTELVIRDYYSGREVRR